MRAEAAVFVNSGHPLEVRSYPVLQPEPGMAVVDLVSSGICGTDVHIWEGAIPFAGSIILGHEFLGRVRALSPSGANAAAEDCLGRPVHVGDLVAVNVIEPCGQCLLCRTGGAASCLNLLASLTYTRSPEEPPHFHGGYSEVNASPIRCLHRLPEGLPADVAAAFLCAGPTIVRAMEYAGGVQQGDRVIIQGSGPVGLFAALWASRHGAGLTVLIGSSSNPERLRLARKLGADLVLDIRATSVEERQKAVMEHCDSIGADLIIECSGAPEAVPEGLGLLRPRARYSLAGQYSNRGSVPIPVHQITFNALQIIGSAQFTAEDRERCFRFLLDVPDVWDTVRAAVTHRLPVIHADRALQAVRSGHAIKALLVP